MKPARPLPLALVLLALTFALRVDVAGATITEFSGGLTPGVKPMGLTAGPDGMPYRVRARRGYVACTATPASPITSTCRATAPPATTSAAASSTR